MPASITFAGHSTFLVELGQTRLLTDPLLRDRLLVVLRRHRGIDREALGRIDGVLVSHLHPDHLDLRSLRKVGTSVPIVVARGGGGILERGGFERVTELAAGEATELAGIPVEATPARHFGGRHLGFGARAFAGYVIDGPPRVYFAGDTELFGEMAALRGRVDVAMLPIWVWGRRVGRGHLGPESAARVLAMIQPRIAVPMHWGTLAPIGARRIWPWIFERPGREFAAHARRLAPDVDVRVLRPGESTRLE